MLDLYDTFILKKLMTNEYVKYYNIKMFITHKNISRIIKHTKIENCLLIKLNNY